MKDILDYSKKSQGNDEWAKPKPFRDNAHMGAFLLKRFALFALCGTGDLASLRLWHHTLFAHSAVWQRWQAVGGWAPLPLSGRDGRYSTELLSGYGVNNRAA